MSNLKLKVEKVHQTEARRTFSEEEISLILADIVAQEAGMDLPHMRGIRHRVTNVTAQVTIIEDSDTHKFRAFVKLTQDHLEEVKE